MVKNVERKQVWRIASLVLLILAMLGPWVYDRINVPAEYPCLFPNVRLEGDFCGVPLSGIRIQVMMLEAFNQISMQYMAGVAIFPARAREFLFSITFILLLLPLLSTALVLLRPNSRSLQVFHLGIWGLATILGLFWSVMVLSNTHMHKWSLWGVWIYLVLAVSMLVLEGFALTAKKEPPMDWKAEYNV